MVLRAVLDSIFTKAANQGRLPAAPNLTTVIPWGAPVPVNQLAQLNASGATSWLFAVIDRIAQAVAAAEWKLYRVGRMSERLEVSSHPLKTLWESVNPFYTHEEFIELSVQHFELTGEIWWVLVENSTGTPVEMWPIRPDRMKPIPDRDNHIAGYIYTIGSERIPLEVEDVIFIRRPSPTDPYRGIGVVQSLMTDLDSERHASMFSRNFFYNSAEPGGVIEFEQGLSDAEFTQFAERWKAQHQGASNAHRVAILERGVWKDRAFSQRDMQFEQLRRFSRDVILGAFGMPGHMLGLSESVNRANAEAGEVMFSRWIVRPILARIKSVVNSRLAPQFGDDLLLDYIDPTPANREYNLEVADRGYRGSFLTRNEARLLIGQDEVEEGDDFAEPSLGPLGLSLPTQRKGFEIIPITKVANPEVSMRRGWARLLRTELSLLTAYLASIGHIRSSRSLRQKVEVTDIEGYDWDWWTKYEDQVVQELSQAVQTFLRRAAPGVGPSMAQQYAQQYAEHRGAQLLRLDGEVSVVAATKARVNILVSRTISQGESLQQLSKDLREDFGFSPRRAELIARTETATALGVGEKEAAVVMGRDEKFWFTQGDDRVDSDICQGNEAQGWISIDENFQSGHEHIPGHPACRCVTRYRTSGGSGVNPAEDLLVDALQGEGPSCPRCGFAVASSGRARQWCKVCKAPFRSSKGTVEA